ncbi:nuclear transport factor 2 family protein [Haliea sp. E17]|uniref:nuclear transport factor 2 family protein n=1 Tax=Haliea sp. E17 TaxID=3401576 RepID=UPI003AAC0694
MSEHRSVDSARLTQLLDRQEILDCLYRISRAIDRFDREQFLSAYHTDAVIDAGSLVGPPGEVYDKGAELHEHGQLSTLHNLLNHYCEIDGDSAHTETYFFYHGLNRDGSNWVGGGRYLDRLERREGLWKVAFRYTIMEWSGAVEGSQVPLFQNIPDLQANGRPSRTPDDPSYTRPLINRRAMSAPVDVRNLSRPKSS